VGMYTKLHCNIKIKKAANECIEILKYMLGQKEKIDFEIPKHDFFKEESRWDFMLKCCSCYFTDSQNSNLKEGYDGYILHCDCDFKNYENEIELFLDWISQYGNYNNYYEFIGYEIYEENKYPNLIYMKENKFKIVSWNEDHLESKGDE